MSIMTEDRKVRKTDNRCVIFTLVLGLAVGIGAGILIGRFAICTDTDSDDGPDGLHLPGVSDRLLKDQDESVISEAMNQVNSDNIKEFLRCVLY